MDGTTTILNKGGVGVLPTDTIYGLVGRALQEDTVEKIYQLKKRVSKKPFIILISSLDDLNLFHVIVSPEIKKLLQKVWPGKVSVILPCQEDSLFYLHRGTNNLAFRIPKDKKLLKLLQKAGPLVAPSANLEGLTPAKNIEEAKKYFGNKIDFYIDGGQIVSEPSTLISIENNRIKILREGVAKLSQFCPI